MNDTPKSEASRLPESGCTATVRTGILLVFVGTLGILILAILPPFVSKGLRDTIMAMFSGVCHQLPGRSPHLAGVQLGVCHRCFGIYSGLPLAALVFAILRTRIPKKEWKWGIPAVLVASVLPMGIDWTGNFLGFWVNTPVSRISTGLIFGLVAGWILVSTVVESAMARRSPRR